MIMEANGAGFYPVYLCGIKHTTQEYIVEADNSAQPSSVASKSIFAIERKEQNHVKEYSYSTR